MSIARTETQEKFSVPGSFSGASGMVYATEQPIVPQETSLVTDQRYDSERETAIWARVAADIERLAQANEDLRRTNEELARDLREAMDRIDRLERRLKPGG